MYSDMGMLREEMISLDFRDYSEYELLVMKATLDGMISDLSVAIPRAARREAHERLAQEIKDDSEWSICVKGPSSVDKEELNSNGLGCFDLWLPVALGTSVYPPSVTIELDGGAYVREYLLDEMPPVIKQFAEQRRLPEPEELTTLKNRGIFANWEYDKHSRLTKKMLARVTVVYLKVGPDMPKPAKSLYMTGPVLCVVPGWDPDPLLPGGDLLVPFYGSYKEDTIWPPRVFVSDQYSAFQNEQQ